MNKIGKFVIGLTFSAVIMGGLGLAALKEQSSPTSPGKEQFIRLDSKTPRMVVFRDLAKKGIIKSAQASELVARTSNQPTSFKRGTYRLKPGMDMAEIVKALNTPVQLSVRLPEGYWIARTAEILEQNDICTAQEYIDMTQKPDEFRKEFAFLPKGITSLEGFLYPDTYFFVPKLGAKEVIREQLGIFKRKALPLAGDASKLLETINIAAMVDLETAKDFERPIVSGVIHNRIRIGMPLQIDATVLYALQKWYELPPGFVGTVDSPYNTYRIPGLPPGPIASPTDKSIEAAANPATHNYLYYMAKPDKSHFFAATYSEHNQNINRARAMR